MLLTSEFPEDVRVEKEMDALNNAGHEVHLACYTQKERPKYEKCPNYIVHRKLISSFIYKSSVGCLKFPFYFNFWRKFVTQLFKNENFDAIHIHDLPLAKIGYEIKIKYKIPFILDLHENWPASLEIATHTNTFLGKLLSSNKQWRKYEKRFLGQANSIITVVDEMKMRISKLGIDKNKIYIVSNTINTKDFPLYDDKSDLEFITLFYAGGINIHRGLQVVIKAVSLIIKEKQNIRLNIIGKGSYQSHLEKLVNDLNLENHIKFLGWKNLNEISKLLAKSDIALIPHLKSEQTDCSSPNKLYQYIYAKKPILTSNCDSLVRIVKETKSGLVYTHNSPEDFKKMFFKLLINQNSIIDLEHGSSLINSKYNWSVDSDRLVGLYNNFI